MMLMELMELTMSLGEERHVAPDAGTGIER
jgi:hypothetical protein